MPDPFQHHPDQLDSPAANMALVTPDDDNDLANYTRGIIVGTAGDIAVVTVGGQSLTIPNVTAGDHPYRLKRIKATGTTASGIVAMW